ncbi:hypothetical protein RRG08_038173 [Elysia crispata]|uniref:Uncharacterized protein n=1 Tax=Elysia crispata TaxID=231223 RepID=A0AAE1E1C1_9GAST|nr:hypothetical protein RRG08_038173 [Elysia crispata]
MYFGVSWKTYLGKPTVSVWQICVTSPYVVCLAAPGITRLRIGGAGWKYKILLRATASVSERVSTIRSALLGLESRGWVFCRGSQHSQSHSHSHSHSQSQSHSRDADRFEIITSQSPLSKHVLSVLRDACLHSLKNSETGCHLLNLLDRIQQSGRQGAAGVYKSVTKLILERALTCLIISSDVIEVDHQRYLPVE